MLIHIGYGNFVQMEWISDIASAENAEVRRMIAGAREDGLLINATAGKALRSVIILKSGHVISSALKPEILSKRIKKASDVNNRLKHRESLEHPFRNEPSAGTGLFDY